MKEFHPRAPAAATRSCTTRPTTATRTPADHSILVPVIDDDGATASRVLARPTRPTAATPSRRPTRATARDVYEEGALIFPCVKVQSDYRDIEDVIRMCQLRIRVPEQVVGRLPRAARRGARRRARAARARRGGRLGRARRTSRGLVRLQRAAAWSRRSGGCPAGGSPSRLVPRPVPAACPTACRSRSRSTIDATTADRGRPARQPRLPAVRPQPDRGDGALGGDARRVQRDQRHAPAERRAASGGCTCTCARTACVGIPRHPASCSVATCNLADRVANAVQRAIAELADGFGQAEVGLSVPASVGVISGHDPRARRRAVHQPAHARVHGRSRRARRRRLADDGRDRRCRRVAVELGRDRRVALPGPDREPRIVPDSEGAGYRRGAPSAAMELTPTVGEFELMFLSDGTIHPALGSAGRRCRRDGVAGAAGG